MVYKIYLWVIGMLISLIIAGDNSTNKEMANYDSLSTEKAIIAIQEKYNLPSLCLALVNEDSLLVQIEHGIIAVGQTKKVTSEMEYQIGSLSKAFTSYIAACLVEESVISWEAKLVDIVPTLKEVALNHYTTITLTELLSHRAGLPDYTTVESLNNLAKEKAGADAVVLAKQLVKEKPVTEGTFLYSNVGYSLASLMLEKVSGKSFRELIDIYIGEPFGIEY